MTHTANNERQSYCIKYPIQQTLPIRIGRIHNLLVATNAETNPPLTGLDGFQKRGRLLERTLFYSLFRWPPL